MKNNKLRVALVIPAYNAQNGQWAKVLEAICQQKTQPDRKIIIDSDSSDSTVSVGEQFGFECYKITKSEFNHGLTRQFGVSLAGDVDIVIFMTQDALLNNDTSFSAIVSAFDNSNVGVAYGRQLPGEGSSFTERVSRSFNYPELSRIKSMNDIKVLGLHTAFCSDSYAAYRVVDLHKVGGFPETNFGEDMLVAARMLMAGFNVAYVAEATCIHSHEYSLVNEFARGKAIGTMHRENPWLLETFGQAENRGSALLGQVKFWQKPKLILQNLPKYFGYLLGQRF